MELLPTLLTALSALEKKAAAVLDQPMLCFQLNVCKECYKEGL